LPSVVLLSAVVIPGHRRSAQDKERTKDEAEGRFNRTGGLIELPARGAAESLDARWLPMGEIGQGAVLGFAVLAVGLTKENGGRGVAVGDGRDVHADLMQQKVSYIKVIINTYMQTNLTKKELNSNTNHDLPKI
jgi:hypothetical protein